jgi:hypothetical protein
MDCECGCGRAAALGGRLSSACYKQRKRTGSTRRTHPAKAARYSTPREAVLEAVNGLADVDPTEQPDWHRAWNRFWMAVRRYQSRNSVQKPPDTTPRG